MTTLIAANTAELLQAIATNSSGVLLTGLTSLRVRLLRTADNYVWDWDGSSAFDSPGTAATPLGTLVQIDATNAPGLYSLSWPGATAGVYLAVISQTGTDAANMPQVIELRVGGLGAIDATAGAVAQAAALATAQADLDDIQTRIPASLAGGRMDSSVGAVAANAITAAAIATDAIDADAIAASAVTEIQTGLATGTAVADIQTAVDAIALDVDALVLSVADLPTATDVWAEATRTLTGIGSSGIASQASVDAVPTAAENADAVLDEALVGHVVAGSTGEAVGRLDVAVSTRAATGAAMALTPAERLVVQALVLSDATPFPGARIDATVTSRAQPGDAMALTPSERTSTAGVVDTTLALAHGAASWATAIGFSTLAAADVWSVGTRTLTGVGASGIALESSLSSLSAAVALLPSAATIADATWDELLAGHATAGSAGATLTTAGAGASASTIAAAVWSAVEGSPAVGTMGYAQKLGRQWFTNRSAVTAGTSANFILYADDTTTPLLTFSLTDGAGLAITTPTGSPARRSAAA